MLRYTTIICLVLISLFAATQIITQKISIENKNKAVEMVMDYNDILNLAAISNNNINDTLKDLNTAGVNTVSLEMDTISTAITKGHVVAKEEGIYEIKGYKNIVLISNLFKSILGEKCNIDISNDLITIKYDTNTVNKQLIESIPIGFYEKNIIDLKKSNYILCARIPDFMGVKEENISSILNYLKLLEIDQIIFLGDTITGYKDLIPYLSSEMTAKKIYFGKVEFSKQKGEQVLASKSENLVLPTHSISITEMQGMTESTIIERFTKAVRERGIKILYIRPMYLNDANPLEHNTKYIKNLKNSINKAGYQIKHAHSYEKMPYFKVFKCICAVGVAAIIICILSSLFRLSNITEIIMSILIIALFIYMALIGSIMIKILTFMLAISTPILAIIAAIKSPKDGLAKSGNLTGSIVSFLIAFSVTLYGCLLNLALLSTNSFMLRNEVFIGVKMAHFLPLVTVGLLLSLGIIWNKQTPKETWISTKRVFANAMEKPILIGYMLIGIVSLILIGIMLARSGNDAGLEVSTLELKFRSLLDQIVYVRPRTKEFLLGYPALLIGIYYALQNKRGPACVLITLGTIALVSLFNTFCHIHTPVILSIIRAFNGLWCGLLVGLLTYLIFIRKTSATRIKE